MKWIKFHAPEIWIGACLLAIIWINSLPAPKAEPTPAPQPTQTERRIIENEYRILHELHGLRLSPFLPGVEEKVR